MHACNSNHRPVGFISRDTSLRIIVIVIFIATLCFTQVASAQHFHAPSDIDQACVICRFTDTEDILVPLCIQTDTSLEFHSIQTEHYTAFPYEALFGYQTRAPPFSAYD